MKNLFLSIILISFSSVLGLAQPTYHADLIPKNLRSYASAVVRSHETIVEVKALDEVSYKVKEAITILNNSGEEYGYLTINYNKSHQIKSVRASIYNAQGELIKKAGNSDFQDVSSISNFSLFEDDRLRFFKPQIADLPYTVVYEYELKLKQTLHLPEWHPQPSSDIAVENSIFTFLTNPDFKTRIREVNLTQPRQETTEKGLQKISWQVQNLAAHKSEPFSPPAENYLPGVELAPVQFKYEGINGQYTNWQEFGQWTYQNLLKERDVLTPATVTQVTELVKDCASTQEKIQKIYQFVQNKTRYISIQIGIGGLQPMLADEVDRLGYGDCKALTNYTKSLLQVAGIPSIYTLVHSGSTKRNFSPEFASLQGNHAILCVPVAKQDTIWLECTDKEAPTGFLGSFTDDRYVLLCTENGGVITRTPRYDARQNQQLRNGSFTLDAGGNLNGKIETRFEGTQYENREGFREKSPKEKLDAVRKLYALPNLDIVQYDLKQQKTGSPATIEKLELKANQAATLNGNLILLQLNQLNHEVGIPKEVRNRKNKVYINRGFIDEDVISYQLPEGYKPEYLPGAVDVQTPFGRYKTQIKLNGTELTYTRHFSLNQGEYAPEAYEQLVTFLKKVVDQDHEKLVLVKM